MHITQGQFSFLPDLTDEQIRAQVSYALDQDWAVGVEYGQEAIEILLQAMENNREDIVVILAGYRERMDTFFRSNPGLRSRIAHHIEFPDYGADELLVIAELLLEQQGYRFDEEAREAFRRYIARRMTQPHFANARSMRNALDRCRLRQALRLAKRGERLSAAELATIKTEVILASRVFRDRGGDSADGRDEA